MGIRWSIIQPRSMENKPNNEAAMRRLGRNKRVASAGMEGRSSQVLKHHHHHLGGLVECSVLGLHGRRNPIL